MEPAFNLLIPCEFRNVSTMTLSRLGLCHNRQKTVPHKCGPGANPEGLSFRQATALEV